MKGWITPLRLAAREARKAKGRSALVLAMIGLPVACLAFLAASYDMFQLTTREELDRRVGAADALLMWESGAPIAQGADGHDFGPVDGGLSIDPGNEADLLALLPPGTRLARIDTFDLRLRSPSGVGTMSARLGVPGDPMSEGMVKVLEGTAPDTDGEAALNPAAAEKLKVKVGDTLHSVTPDLSFTVTAIVEYPQELYPILVVPSTTKGLPLAPQGGWWLADTAEPVDWATVQRLNTKGIRVTSREVMLNPPPDPAPTFDNRTEEMLSVGSVIAGLAIVEVMLLAGPAFAVGARRRARDLALVAAAGGEPKHLRRLVLADGAVLGFAGALGGIVLGVAAAFAAVPLLEVYAAGSRIGGYRVFPLAQLGIVVLAVGTGLLAALVPAYTAARQDVVQTLNGRRGTVRSRKRWIAVGAGMAATGVVAATAGAFGAAEELILAGIVLAEMGLVLLTPALIGLAARAARWLPLAPRLALRDTARNRSSAAPAISAVMAAVAGAVMMGTMLSGSQRQYLDDYHPSMPMGHLTIQTGMRAEADWPSIEAAVRQELPGADVRLVQRSGAMVPVPEENKCPAIYLDGDPTDAELAVLRTDKRCDRSLMWGDGALGTVVDDGAALAAMTAADPAGLDGAQRALARGEVVVTVEHYLVDGKVTIDGISFIGYRLEAQDPAAAVIMPEPVARRLSSTDRTRALVAGTPGISKAEQERLSARVAAVDQDAWVYVERGPRSPDDSDSLMFALAAAAIALIAAGAATGLAAVDGRAALGTLAAIGATPRLRRMLSLSRAGIISGLGAVLGTLTGLGGAAVLILALNRSAARDVLFGPSPIPVVLSWQAIAVIVAVPLVAMAGAGLLTRSQLSIERRL